MDQTDLPVIRDRTYYLASLALQLVAALSVAYIAISI